MESNNKNDFQWKDEYKLGDKTVDEQHKKLFTIIEKAHLIRNLATNEEKKNELNAILREIYHYTNTHFKEEEVYLKKINYPQLEEHMAQHKIVEDKINFMSFSVRSMNIEQAQNKLFEFVEKILLHHITVEDLKVITYLKSLQK